MKHYTQLDHEQRYQISGLHKAGWKQTQIADEMGMHKSTISREFRRNKGRRGWRPKQAQSMRDERKQACINGKQFSPNEWAEVERLTRKDLSPEHVANRLELEGSLLISPKTIYLRIYADKRNGGMAETCTNIYETRNRAASVMQAGKNDVARSRTVSTLMIARTSLLTKHAWVTGKAIPSSARTTKAGWSRWLNGWGVS